MANRKYKEQKMIVIELKPFTTEEKNQLLEIRTKWDEDDRSNNSTDL